MAWINPKIGLGDLFAGLANFVSPGSLTNYTALTAVSDANIGNWVYQPTSAGSDSTAALTKPADVVPGRTGGVFSVGVTDSATPFRMLVSVSNFESYPADTPLVRYGRVYVDGDEGWYVLDEMGTLVQGDIISPFEVFNFADTPPGPDGSAWVGVGVEIVSPNPTATGTSIAFQMQDGGGDEVTVTAVDDEYVVAANSTATQLNVYSNDLINGNPAEEYSEPWGTEVLLPPSHGSITRSDNISFNYTPVTDFVGSDSFSYTLSAYDPSIEDFRTTVAIVEITVEGGPEPQPFKVITNRSVDVYEFDRGDHFDNMYIPHMLELNWYFGENPIQFTTVQKVRTHGLSKGYARLQMSINGMDTDYEDYFTEPQHFDLPREMDYVTTDMTPQTAMVDTAGRGISVQLKFTGRPLNDGESPYIEPCHALQLLIVRAGPGGRVAD